MCNKPAEWRSLTIDDLFDLPRTLVEAKNLGIKYFFTGKFCRNGHMHCNSVLRNRCVLCSAESEGSDYILPRYSEDTNKISERRKIKRRGIEPLCILGINVKIKEKT